MTKMFVYGTLKRGYGNNRYMGGCEFLGDAISHDATYSMSGYGVPFLSEGGGQRVKGELWEVTKEALPGIDRLEGHPRFYCREERLFIKEDGTRVLAWVYLVPPELVEARGYHSETEEILQWAPGRHYTQNMEAE